jgi:phosphatidate cytidylyltransferase
MTWVCLALAATWGGDIGGYLVGRGLGRRPLAPVLSPHKTVEGAVGGLATSLLIGGALVAAGLPDRAVGLLLALILAASLAGQAGDLFESSLKRHRGIKDSSHLLGAQGGMLDCLDGLCFAAPLLQAGRMALG